MSCPSVERLYDHLEGILPAGERDVVESHLAACPACRRVRAAWERIAVEASGLPAFDVPEDFAARVMEQVGSLPAPAARRKLGPWIFAPTAAAAAVATTVGLWTVFAEPGSLAFGAQLRSAAAFAAKGLKLLFLGAKIVGDASLRALDFLKSVAGLAGPETQAVLAVGTIVILVSGGLFLRRRSAASERTHEK